MFPAGIERHERAPLRLERLDRAAASGTVDEPHDRHPQLVCHAFRVHLLLEDRRVGRAAPHREVIAADNHRTRVDTTPPHDEVRGSDIDELAVVVVRGASGERADLVERARVEQGVDAFPDRELALGVMTLDLLRAAQALRELVPARQFLELRLPTHLLRAHGRIHRGRLPVAAEVLPVSRYAEIARSAVRMRWISSAPSANRAQRACRNMSASGVSFE